MKFKFLDKNNNELDVSNFIVNSLAKKIYPKPDFPDIKTNTKILERFSIDGGYETGDGTIKTRSNKLSIDIVSTSDKNFRLIYNIIANFFRPENRPFYTYDSDNQVRQKISFKGINSKYIEGAEMRVSSCSIDYEAIDPLFETDEIIVTTLNVIPNQTISINTIDMNSLSPNYQIPVRESIPIIEIKALATNPDFVINNLTTEETFRIIDSSFTTGRTISVSTFDGEVKNENIVNNKILSSGRPFKLINGINNIQYQCPVNFNVDIQIKYRRRYVL
jgi:hypothetical protein